MLELAAAVADMIGVPRSTVTVVLNSTAAALGGRRLQSAANSTRIAGSIVAPAASLQGLSGALSSAMANASVLSKFVARVAAAAGVPASSMSSALTSVAVATPSGVGAPVSVPSASSSTSNSTATDVLAAVLALVVVAGSVFFARQRWAQQQAGSKLHRGPKVKAGAGTGANVRAQTDGGVVYENPLLQPSPLRGRTRVAISSLLPPVASPSELAALARLSAVQAMLAEREAQLAAADEERDALRSQLAATTARLASAQAPVAAAIAKPQAAASIPASPRAVAAARPAAAAVDADEWKMIVEDDGDVYYEHPTLESTRDEPPSHRRAREAKAKTSYAALRR